jgi:hypothetical protein
MFVAILLLVVIAQVLHFAVAALEKRACCAGRSCETAKENTKYEAYIDYTK